MSRRNRAIAAEPRPPSAAGSMPRFARGIRCGRTLAWCSQRSFTMNDDQLDTWLGDIAREDDAVKTPPHVEARTMAAWDEWRRDQTVATERVLGRRWALGALAALA